MRYVEGGAAGTGCIFCDRLAANDDVRALVLHRGPHAFAILNLYPYNTGHLMLVPTAHVPDPETADPAALTAIAALLPAVTRALRRALGCHGFNVGLNIGAVAGAGVADHIHQHVVPRWTGDANFMPILAATMVLPELIPVTYAKLRAELTRELAAHDPAFPRPGTAPAPNPGHPSRITAVVLSPDLDRVLAVPGAEGWHLPTADAAPEEPLWRAAARVVTATAGDAPLVGWAGPGPADTVGTAALTYRLAGGHAPVEPPARLVPLPDGPDGLADAADQARVRAALAHLPAEDTAL